MCEPLNTPSTSCIEKSTNRSQGKIEKSPPKIVDKEIITPALNLLNGPPHSPTQ